MRFDLRDLEVFYWVAQLKNFRRAAERLNATQPGISQRIAGLEAALGAKLFQRGARSSVLTPKGRQLLDAAERILGLVDEISRTVADPSALSGVVRLGVAETVVHTWLSEFIEQVHATHPHVTLDIEVDVSPNLRNALIDGEIDLAFLLGPVSDPRVVNLDLCRYPLAFIAAKELDLGRARMALADLMAHPIITYPKTTRPYIMLRQVLAAEGHAPPRIYSNSSLSTIVRMTLDRIGVSVIPPTVIEKELKSGELRVVQTDVVLPDLVFTATYAHAPGAILVEQIARMATAVAQKRS